jgi:hypothetical protein
VSYQAAHVTWRWNAAKHGFNLAMDGSAANVVGAGQVLAANVIVQYVRVVASRLHDVNHMPTPYTYTVGSGNAVFFRDGHAIPGTWRRPSAKSGTTWKVGTQPYMMKPGRTWVILVPKITPIRYA